MKKFNKLISSVIAGVMLVGMVGCGGSSSSGTSSPQASKPEETTKPAVESEVKTAVDGQLTWATNAAFPPYEFYEGDAVVGIDAEIAQYIAGKMGLEASCEDMEFDSIIVAVSSGKADMGLAGMSITEDRKKSVDFSKPYVDASQVVVVRFDSPIKTANDIEGKTVGVQLGTTGDEYVSDPDKYSDLKVERYNKGFEAIEALLQKKIDAVVIDGDTAKEFVAANDDLAILEEVLTEEQYAIAVAKGNTALLDQINAAIDELQAEGKLDEIKAKYSSTGEESTTEAASKTDAA